jgi:hypothetical protein
LLRKPQCLDTGFLADLYVNLSETAQAEYALIETPGFVASMILDHTLTPAMQAFGLPGLRFIDPVCGSGTFVLGAFGRLRDAWRATAPDASLWDHIRCALASIHGVDKERYSKPHVIEKKKSARAAPNVS